MEPLGLYRITEQPLPKKPVRLNLCKIENKVFESSDSILFMKLLLDFNVICSKLKIKVYRYCEMHIDQMKGTVFLFLNCNLIFW